MTYKKVMALANKFFIKLADPSEPTTVQDKKEKSHENIPEVPSHLQQLIRNRRLTDPGNQPAPEETEFANKTKEFAHAINTLLDQDYGALTAIGYFEKYKREKFVFIELMNKMKELTPVAAIKPFEYEDKMTDFLYESPTIKLIHKPTNKKSNTNLDNINTIYFDAYSDSIIRHREKLDSSRSQMLRPLKIMGLRKLMLFEAWSDANLRRIYNPDQTH